MTRIPMAQALALSLFAALAIVWTTMPPMAQAKATADEFTREQCSGYVMLHVLLDTTARARAFAAQGPCQFLVLPPRSAQLAATSPASTR
jgi:hypothetical protein